MLTDFVWLRVKKNIGNCYIFPLSHVIFDEVDRSFKKLGYVTFVNNLNQIGEIGVIFATILN